MSINHIFYGSFKIIINILIAFFSLLILYIINCISEFKYMGLYSELYNSSRGVIFMWVAMIIAIIPWVILRFINKKFILSEEKYESDKQVQGSGEQIQNNPSEIKSNKSDIKKQQPQQATEPKGVKFILYFEKYLFEFAPFMAMSILAVVLFHGWAFNLVNVFLTSIPIFIVNILGLIQLESGILKFILKFWWGFWVLGWFLLIFIAS